VAAAAAGDLAIDGALPFVGGAGIDEARNRALALTSLATLSGTPFEMPAGDASLTIKAGYDFNRTLSDDTRSTLGTIRLKRGDVQGGFNLALPLTGGGVLDGVGDLTLNLSGGLNHLSDFGTLKNWSAGVTWSPTDTLNFQASYLVEDAAPTLAQLGAPTILNYNVPVYDFANSQTALVTTATGGNPDLRKEKQRDIKISGTWQLPFMERANILVEYFRNRSSDVTQSFPLLTPAIEAAFPERITRDAAGNLIAIDRRAVTYDEVNSSSLRWGINLSGSLGSSSGGGSSGRGESRRAGAVSASGPAQPVAGPNGPMPRGQGTGGAGETRAGVNSERFAAIRQQLCTPSSGEPDLSALPESLRARLVGADGKVDPAKLAQFKARACSADGASPPAFDPERMARMRAALCSGGTPDLTALPERMAERLRGADGKVDQARLAEARKRVCSSDGSGQVAGSAGVSNAGEARAGGAPMMGGRRGPGSRWNIAVYHTWRFTDRVRIAPGVPVLDALEGDAIAAGGVPRHAIEAEGGVFKNGYGLRLKAEWEGPATVNGTDLLGSSDLRFGSTFNVDMRFFADLGRNESLVSKVPFLKGARLALTVDNLFDQRQRVTDETGAVPIAYQAAYRQPQGRVIGIDFRKLF
jgi:Outer membrane cobalamin receptor protein